MPSRDTVLNVALQSRDARKAGQFPFLFLASLCLCALALPFFLVVTFLITAIHSNVTNTDVYAFLADLENCVSPDPAVTCDLGLRPRLTDIDILLARLFRRGAACGDRTNLPTESAGFLERRCEIYPLTAIYA